MRFRTRFAFVCFLAALASLPALGQGWGAGASFGSVQDVSHSFALDKFHHTDWNGWLQFELEDRVQLRGTYGQLKTRGANSEQVVTSGSGVNFNAPVLTSQVRYGTLGVAYEFWEGDYKSGLFAGIGMYQNHPDPAPSAFEAFNDPRRTVVGWHVGVDGSIRVVSRLSLVGRFTLHRFRAGTGRSILTTNAGLLYRF